MGAHLLRATGCAAAFLLVVASMRPTHAQPAEVTRALFLRGHHQTLHLYGTPNHAAVIVSSGDGGWIHLAPHVAATLAGDGYFVVGFDVNAYLASFTSGTHALTPADVAADYALLVADAGGTSQKPVLVGVSEGAGLSLLAATDPVVKASVSGVVGLGLPDRNELGWRWRDDITYITHKLPDEPSFSTAAAVPRLAPLPLAALHSAHDEYVPLAEVQRVVDRAAGPRRLWILNASDHRFSGAMAQLDRCLLEAMEWVHQHAPNQALAVSP